MPNSTSPSDLHIRSRFVWTRYRTPGAIHPIIHTGGDQRYFNLGDSPTPPIPTPKPGTQSPTVIKASVSGLPYFLSHRWIEPFTVTPQFKVWCERPEGSGWGQDQHEVDYFGWVSIWTLCIVECIFCWLWLHIVLKQMCLWGNITISCELYLKLSTRSTCEWAGICSSYTLNIKTC